MRTIVIPDLHGCLYTLQDALSKINISSNDKIVFLGDYIEKGLNSFKLVNFLIRLKKTHNIILLKGNHEAILLQGIIDNNLPLIKLYKETDLTSMFCGEKLKPQYFHFFDSLLPYYELNEFLFVHAGVDLTQESIENQGSYYYFEKTVGMSQNHNIKHIIHGHFVTNTKIIKNTIKERKFNFSIDNGCNLVARKGYGKLVTFDLNGFFAIFHQKSKFDE